MPISFQSVLDSSLGAPATNETFAILRGLFEAHPDSQHIPIILTDEDEFPFLPLSSDVSVDGEYSAEQTSSDEGDF